MQELAELDKKEMENEYQQFADQYSEMKTQINNDPIVAQLTAEQKQDATSAQRIEKCEEYGRPRDNQTEKELATVRSSSAVM